MTTINNKLLGDLFNSIALSNKEQYEIKGGITTTADVACPSHPTKLGCLLKSACNAETCMSACTTNCMVDGCNQSTAAMIGR